MYDPIELAARLEGIVAKNNLRKYYRFRPARFYGGIATADCVGCCLRCAFCWSRAPLTNPEQVGRFYSPQEIFSKLDSIARKRGYSQVRVSGNEPTVGRRHLLRLLELVETTGYSFILETNGILLGADVSYARELAKFENLHVRVSLKVVMLNSSRNSQGQNPKLSGYSSLPSGTCSRLARIVMQRSCGSSRRRKNSGGSSNGWRSSIEDWCRSWSSNTS